MKNLLKILFILFIISHITFSQWVPLSSGTNSLLLELTFPDANTGYSVGISGLIIKTTNAGVNWVSPPNSITDHLYGVFFINSSTGFVIGDASAAYKTTNGGTNWFSMSLPIVELLRGIYFTDASTGYIGGSGGKIVKTTNGGTNWSELSTGTAQFIYKLNFPNASTGFAGCSSGVIVKTTNSGASWVQINTGITEPVYGIHVWNADTIYACGENGKIIKSVNSGINWVQQTSGSPARLLDIYFANSLTGTTVGLGNTIIRTTNGGAEWLSQQSGVTGQDFLGVWFTSITTGYVCGSNGTILKTVTGGFPYPSQPVLNSPPNGANGISLTPVLDWDTVTTAKTYDLQLATDSSFTNLVIDTALLVNTQLPVQPGRLANNTLYYWRVRGENIVGYGPYSATFRFRTIVAFPLPPNLLLPPNNANNVSLTPTFDWDSNSVATYYTLQVSLDTSFTTFAVFADGITQSFYTVITPLSNNLRYYWRVKTTNNAGTSPWSLVFSFITVFGFPSPPTLLSPPHGTVGVSLTPTLRWVKDISAITYQAQISTDSLFGTTVIDTTGFDSSQVTIRPGVLVNIRTYYWRVRTTNSFGTSGWSEAWRFFTLLSPPAAPVLVSPPNNAINIDLTPTLNWDSVQYSQTYRVQVATDPAFSNLVINVGSLPVSQYTIGGGALSNNTVYYWRVNATNGAGTSPYSAVWNFRTVISPPVVAPTLLSPPNFATNVSVTPTLDWNDVFGSQGYRLQLSDDSLFNSFIIDTTITPSQFIVPPGFLQPTTTYYWKVRGFNIGGFGPFSVTWRFTTGVVGINQISSEIPKEFKLHNNYPNPFNPVTRIRFDIPVGTRHGAFVQIIIFDILGREITTLVNENLSPGYYETSWDAANYPSGVYLYRIQTGKYTAVKKMIVVK